MEIGSVKNPKIKHLVLLQEKSSLRQKTQSFLLEGLKELSLAKQAGYVIDELLVCPKWLKKPLEGHLKSINTISISSSVFNKLAYRKESGGVLAVVKHKKHTLENLSFKKAPFFIVVESVEKPGNLGAILRTADAVKADAVMVCNSRVDFYNPNTIRSSIGCVFTNRLIASDRDNVVNWLRQNHIEILATYLNGKTENLYRVNLKKPIALVLGTEATGLSDFWLINADRLIKIPMQGTIDSLNVSNAAAVVSFELMRQRYFT